MVVIASIVSGIVLGALAIFLTSLRLRYENRRLQKKIRSKHTGNQQPAHSPYKRRTLSVY